MYFIGIEIPICHFACGKRIAKIDAIVEGTMFKVCEKCSEYGKVIPIKKPVIKEQPKLRIEKEELIETIVLDYADKIKKAREALNLKQEDVSKKLAEKQSVIHKIETGHLKPSLSLARKFERLFNIGLIENIEEEPLKKPDFKNTTLTIGDILKLKKKR